MLEWSIDVHSAHITPITLKTHIQTQHFLCILTIPPAATCPEINGNSKHTKICCIQLDGSQACSAICRPQSKQTTAILQTLIIHVLLTSQIELWPLTSVCNVCRPQFKWITTNPHTLIILVLFTSTIEL
jgi:hypothetical protein